MEKYPQSFESNETEPVEIERRFKVLRLPENLDELPHDELEQEYLSINPNGDEDRIRKKGDNYYRTQKSGEGVSRKEIENEITEEEYEELRGNNVGHVIAKTRFYISHQENTIELNLFHNELDGLVMAEVEFENEEEAENFVPPDWLGSDVTDDIRFTGKSLAVNGSPEETETYNSREAESAPEYETEEGLAKLIELTSKKLEASDGPVIVEIAGGSASGKTFRVSDEVMKKFQDDAILIPMDDYYRGAAYMEAQASVGNVLNWDQPEALNMSLLKQHLADLKEGKPIQKPKYDFKTGEPSGTEEILPERLIVVEGLFALTDDLAEEGDVRAFVETGTFGRAIRRLLRDPDRTGQKHIDVLKQFTETVNPMHEKHIQNTKRNADIVIHNEYKAVEESPKAKTHELQLKFHGTLDTESLRKLGAEILSKTTQTDYYYNPNDRDLNKTDEMLRIREEGDRKVLAYKGPKIDSDFRQRPKFEFEIDDNTTENLLELFGEQSAVIKKERTLCQLDGIVFSLDEVVVLEDDKEIELGQFIEVRSVKMSNEEEDQESILKAFVTKLDLDFDKRIKDSYMDLVLK